MRSCRKQAPLHLREEAGPDLLATSLKKLFGTSFFTAPYNEAIRTRKLVTLFLKPEVLSDFVGRFDSVCKKSIREDWAGKEQVMSYSLIKKYAFAIACEVLKQLHVLNKTSFEIVIYDIRGTT